MSGRTKPCSGMAVGRVLIWILFSRHPLMAGVICYRMFRRHHVLRVRSKAAIRPAGMSAEIESHMKRWRKRTIVAVACTFGLCALYVFSYAPAVSLLCDPLPQEKYYHWHAPTIKRHPLRCYAPVDWLIDNTLLERPLMSWAKLWGSDDRISLAKFARGFDRPGLERYHYIGD